MRSGSQREHPRHFAAGDRAGHPAPAGGHARHRAHPHAPAHAHHAVAEPVELQDEPARLHLPRHRLALALAVTLAAVPILVMDNLPATAETDHSAVATEAPTTEMSIVLLAPSTTTTVAPATTEAPATSEAPSTTAAPPTTEQAVVEAASAAPPATQPRPVTTTTAAPAPKNGDPNDNATWDKLAQCEAGGNWAANTGNGYYGGLQFSVATWQDVGGTGYPHQASRLEQIKRGKILQARNGWGAWPTCAKQLGYY